MSMFGENSKSYYYDELKSALENEEITLAELLDIISTLVSEDWGILDIKIKGE